MYLKYCSTSFYEVGSSPVSAPGVGTSKQQGGAGGAPRIILSTTNTASYGRPSHCFKLVYDTVN